MNSKKRGPKENTKGSATGRKTPSGVVSNISASFGLGFNKLKVERCCSVPRVADLPPIAPSAFLAMLWTKTPNSCADDDLGDDDLGQGRDRAWVHYCSFSIREEINPAISRSSVSLERKVALPCHTPDPSNPLWERVGFKLLKTIFAVIRARAPRNHTTSDHPDYAQYRAGNNLPQRGRTINYCTSYPQPHKHEPHKQGGR